MMNCQFQLSAVDSYVMTGRDYIYSESMRVSGCVFCLGALCVCMSFCLLHGSAYIICEYGGQRMTGYYVCVYKPHTRFWGAGIKINCGANIFPEYH